jgi:hypothetical protein
MFDTLNLDTDIDRPLRKVFIGTHGNDSGWMQIDLDHNPSTNTTFEVVDFIAGSGAISLSDAARGPETHLHIRGCLIGQSYATPFLTKLKSALGNNVPLAAPRHFHAVFPLPNAGWLESFAYKFEVSRPQRFTGTSARADLIQAFKDKNYTFIGSIGAVHDDWWERWVPRRVNRNGVIRSVVNLNPPIQPRRGNPISRFNFRLNRSFRSNRQRYRVTYDQPTDPGNPTAREQAFRAKLQAEELFQSSHEFPEHQRFRFDSFNDFWDAFTWRVTYNSRRNHLTGVGTRYLYTCIIPVTSDPDHNDSSKNHLIFNFFPASNNANPVITLIDEASTDLFNIV